MRRVSIKDVAKEAGVSMATVSYVLNHNTNETISEETAQRVMKAAARLNYVPNLSARSLSSRRSNLIGVLIPQTEPGKEFMFFNPFYAELLSSIEYTARQNNYHLLLAGTREDQDYLGIARTRGVDGIIIVGTYPGENLDGLRSIGIPVVLVDSYINDEAFHTIGIEDREGAKMATRYLLKKGHHDIAFISGSIREHGVNSKRYQGYCEALREAGLTPQEDALYLGTISQEYGLKAAVEYLKRGKKQTAAFATADVLAVSFIKGCLQNGLRVPKDLSVIGFDDLFLAQMCYPSLTTVHQDVERKGQDAVHFIVNAIENPGCPHQEHILPLRMEERDSVCERRSFPC